MPLSRSLLLFLLVAIGIVVLFAQAVTFDYLPAPLRAPRVVQIEPLNDASEILSTSPITITFSAPMDRAQTETNIEIGPHITGQFAWRDDQTLVFTARPRLPISTTLTINITSNARSWMQRPLENEISSRFTTLTRPYPVSSTPALDAEFVYVPDHVSMTFNRAMDENALADSLEIEPPLQNSSLDVKDRTLTLSGFFEPHRQYRITISGFVFDTAHGIAMDRDYVWSFTTGSQYPNFSILNRERVLKFPANQAAVVPTQFTNVSRLDAALYAITREQFDANTGAPFETWYAFQPAADPLKRWRIATNANLDQYTQQKLVLGSLPPGTYYLKITTPEGVSDAQLVLIE
jgi:hypothetical protein